MTHEKPEVPNNDLGNRLKALYEENSRFHRYDVEWRYRVMTRYFVTTAALLLVAKWFWEGNTEQMRGLMPVPFFLISLFSTAFVILDISIVSRLKASGIVAIRLEKALDVGQDDTTNNGGHFCGLERIGSHIPGRKKGKISFISYSRILHTLYFLTSVTSLFICFGFLFGWI